MGYYTCILLLHISYFVVLLFTVSTRFFSIYLFVSFTRLLLSFIVVLVLIILLLCFLYYSTHHFIRVLIISVSLI